MSLDIPRLTNVDAKQAGQAAFRAINALQTLTPEQQVAGLAVAFQLLSRRFEVHMGTVLTVANNLVDHALHRTPELGATFDYINQEIQ